MNSFLEIRPALLDSSRVGSLSRPGVNVAAAELAVLCSLGAIAAWATIFVHLRLQVPGHAILRGTLPMALGLALVPRRGSGSIMGLSAWGTSAACAMSGLARVQPSGTIGIVALGFLLDMTLTNAGKGWRLYARFMAAGLAANLLAYLARFAVAWLGFNTGGGGGGGGGFGGGGGLGGGWGSGGGQFSSFAASALISFAVCGAIAGLVSGLVWFRSSLVERSEAPPKAEEP